MNSKKPMEYTQLIKLKTREITINAKGIMVEASTLDKYVNECVKVACEKGCPNYDRKWSCPPLSKKYTELRTDHKYGYIVCFSTDMIQYLDVKNKYLAIKAANVSLKTLIEKFVRELEEEYGGYSLLSGSCRLCKPCNRKIGKGCKRPQKMRYSMESTFLQVDKITKDILNHELLWYKDKTLPEYTTTCSLILTNQLIDDSEVEKRLEEFLKR